MSSRRSRSGGRWISIAFSRYSRSARNRPAATSAPSSALVAESTRTSTLMVRDEPTRSSSPVCSTRSNRACCVPLIFAISSRNSVPPSASSNRPMRSAFASVNAPRTCPNSSLSNTPSESPPAFTATRRRLLRCDTAWMVCATTSFPVPGSPVIRMFASDGPTSPIIRSTCFIAGDSAINTGRSTARSTRSSASSFRAVRSARPSSTCVLTMASTRAFSHGFWIKSRAPRRIASTAISTLPHAVITMTGSSESRVCRALSRSSPSAPDVVSRA